MSRKLILTEGNQDKRPYALLTFKDYEGEKLAQDSEGRNILNVGPELLYPDQDPVKHPESVNDYCVGVIMEMPYEANSGLFDPTDPANGPGEKRHVGKHTEWVVLSNVNLTRDWFSSFAKKIDEHFATDDDKPLYILKNTYHIEEILSRKAGNRCRWRFNTSPPATAHNNMFMIGKGEEVFEGVGEVEKVTKTRNKNKGKVKVKCLLDLFLQRCYDVEHLEVESKIEPVFGTLVFWPTTFPTQARAEDEGDQAEVVDTAVDVQKATQSAQGTGDALETEVDGVTKKVASVTFSDEATLSVPGLLKIEESESMNKHEDV